MKWADKTAAQRLWEQRTDFALPCPICGWSAKQADGRILLVDHFHSAESWREYEAKRA